MDCIPDRDPKRDFSENATAASNVFRKSKHNFKTSHLRMLDNKRTLKFDESRDAPLPWDISGQRVMYVALLAAMLDWTTGPSAI